MDSLPEQRIEALPGATRREAYEKIALLCRKRINRLPEDEIAVKAKFGSAEAMHHQLKMWGLSALLPAGAREHKDDVSTARGGGQQRDLPPATNARSIFESVVEKLSVFVERLPLRREYRSGNRFVVDNAKPFVEGSAPGENFGYLEAPPDIPPDEHGTVTYTLDKAYRRVPGGAARYPDQMFTAAITAALLTGTSTDELLDALQDNPTQEVREEARKLFEGDPDSPSSRRDSLQGTAGRMAALLRGYPVSKGNKTKPVSKEQQAAAWAVWEWRQNKYEDDEIVRRLNEDDTFLPELKKRRKVKLDDVRDLESLNFKPY